MLIGLGAAVMVLVTGLLGCVGRRSGGDGA